jgi:MYXO-CTERM domain-containing protein
MHLDLRKPIGLLFTVYGALLVLYGWFALRFPGGSSVRLRLDVIWGGVLLLFGVGLLGLVRRRKTRSPHHG